VRENFRDFETTHVKRYDETAPDAAVPFDDKELEAVMTFVLGLTQEVAGC